MQELLAVSPNIERAQYLFNTPFSQDDFASRASGTTVVLPAPGGACRCAGAFFRDARVRH